VQDEPNRRMGENERVVTSLTGNRGGGDASSNFRRVGVAPATKTDAKAEVDGEAATEVVGVDNWSRGRKRATVGTDDLL
jgi:hypothetical protein